MSNYSRGAAQERKAMQKLIKSGCSYAMRVAGSHSEFDVVAADKDYTYFVQVKSTKKPPVGIVSLLKAYSKDLDNMVKVELNNSSPKELWVFLYKKHEPVKINVFPVEKYTRV